MRTISFLALCLVGLLVGQNTNTYLGPNGKVPGNPQLIPIQILIYNDPDPQGKTIESVTFDQTRIPLKPRDIYGFRGQASFQKRPGRYRLVWVVNRNSDSWPRTETHEQELILSDRDSWIQIDITGDSAAVS